MADMQAEREQNRQLSITGSNHGVTLIELIVALLVATIIMSSIVLFVSVAMNQYRKSADELNLQMESQIVMNLMGDIIIEAQNSGPIQEESMTVDGTDYTVIRIYAAQKDHYVSISGVSPTEAPVPVTPVPESEATRMYNHLFVLDGQSRLLYRRELYLRDGQQVELTKEELETGGYLSDMLKPEQLKKYYLADYIETMSLGYQSTSEKASKLLTLTVEFKCNECEYSATRKISLRNR